MGISNSNGHFLSPLSVRVFVAVARLNTVSEQLLKGFKVA
jgi:hypothetical protein